MANIARKPALQHRLQRLSSPSSGASAVLHSLSLASFVYSFSYLVRNPNQINDSYGWHLQYLTIIQLSLAAATVSTGLAADLTGNRTLFEAKNALSVASAPMACLVSVLYWGLRAIDEKLVLPDWATPLPTQTDLSFHLLPALSLTLDLLLFSPPYTIAFIPALALSLGIAFGYWFWIERCFAVNGYYPYPLFEILTVGQRVGLFVVSALLMAGATMVLAWLYRVVNGADILDLPEIGKGQANGKVKGRGR